MLLNDRKKNNISSRTTKDTEIELLNLFTSEYLDIEELMKIVTKIRDLSGLQLFIRKPKILDTLDEDLLKSYNLAKNELNNLYNTETPILNINIFKDFITNFSKMVGEEIVFKEKDINGLILTDKEDNLYLRFKNGDKIILTYRNFDLSPFNREQLIEILRFLDVKIKDDNYDYLRSEIAKKIAEL